MKCIGCIITFATSLVAYLMAMFITAPANAMEIQQYVEAHKKDIHHNRGLFY